MLKLATQYDFHELFNSDNDMSNSKFSNTVVYFDGKGGNLFLRLRARSHLIYAVLAVLSFNLPNSSRR